MAQSAFIRQDWTKSSLDGNEEVPEDVDGEPLSTQEGAKVHMHPTQFRLTCCSCIILGKGQLVFLTFVKLCCKVP